MRRMQQYIKTAVINGVAPSQYFHVVRMVVQQVFYFVFGRTLNDPLQIFTRRL